MDSGLSQNKTTVPASPKVARIRKDARLSTTLKSDLNPWKTKNSLKDPERKFV